VRMKELRVTQKAGTLRFPIHGTGEETRSFCFIDDLVDGVMLLQERGQHMGIYHIGTMEEVTVADLAHRVARCFGYEIEVIPGERLAGSTLRRCPDIAKIARLGYSPRISLDEGLRITADWYGKNLQELSARD